jgi:glyoxylase-like metal-dependent hydrolase (beta-lactamase superfamily II)
MVAHVLLVETDRGLVLIDAGFSLADVARPGRVMPWLFRAAARPRLDPEQAAVHQVRRLGFRPEDVRHIVLTHMDYDHLGGIGDFPWAKVHVFAGEHTAALAPQTLLDRTRYRPIQWAHGPDWALHGIGGAPWEGFSCVRDLPGLPPEILMVPLPGHTLGHCAVAVAWGEGWLVHAGDAYFHQAQLGPSPSSTPVGAQVFEWGVATDREKQQANLSRLRAFALGNKGRIRVFCAHDAAEFEALRS